MAPGVGFEPTTNALTARCATAALPRIVKDLLKQRQYTEGEKYFQLNFLVLRFQYDDLSSYKLIIAVV